MYRPKAPITTAADQKADAPLSAVALISSVWWCNRKERDARDVEPSPVDFASLKERVGSVRLQTALRAAARVFRQPVAASIPKPTINIAQLAGSGMPVET